MMAIWKMTLDTRCKIAFLNSKQYTLTVHHLQAGWSLEEPRRAGRSLEEPRQVGRSAEPRLARRSVEHLQPVG